MTVIQFPRAPRREPPPLPEDYFQARQSELEEIASGRFPWFWLVVGMLLAL